MELKRIYEKMTEFILDLMNDTIYNETKEYRLIMTEVISDGNDDDRKDFSGSCR